MEMCHCREQPNHGVLSCLCESSPDSGLALVADGVHGHAVDSEVTFRLSQPPRVVGKVRQQEVSNNGDGKGDSTLEDKEPAPAADAGYIVQTVENTSSDQTSKSRCEDVTSIEDGNARGDLLTGVERREKVDSAGVVWGFSDTQEEACEQQTLKVFAKSSKSGDDGPKHHAAAHVATGADTVENHVGGDLAKKVSYEEDRHTRLVLGAGKLEVLLKVIETRQSNSIAIKVVTG